jgi:hypothetical protein
MSEIKEKMALHRDFCPRKVCAIHINKDKKDGRYGFNNGGADPA